MVGYLRRSVRDFWLGRALLGAAFCLTHPPSPSPIPMSEVYNANPTVVSVSKSSKHFSKTSIWMDDIGVTSDSTDDDEVEPIDSEEIFGLFFFTVR